MQTNNDTHTVSNAPCRRALHASRAALAGAVPHSVIALLARIAMGSTFWLSARTKVDGLLTLKDSTFFLFENEYALPVLPVNVAAYLATYSEHLFALMLFVGLGSRLGAAGMLGITAVIQLLVYPSAWPTHLGWAVLLLVIIAQGPGKLSLDHVLFGRR
ncbi:MAG: DoxX family protein [Burkholderiaceae bacterium]|jgi:putative oxidoreductase|tara:strand:+ start:1229 stop:1705 length:477 start_codon:yes stop_codon:yes gene_type:complete